jgi:hypothetical protein
MELMAADRKTRFSEKSAKSAKSADAFRLHRVVPPGTAWDRLGPDKFFSPRRKGGKKSRCPPSAFAFARKPWPDGSADKLLRAPMDMDFFISVGILAAG